MKGIYIGSSFTFLNISFLLLPFSMVWSCSSILILQSGLGSYLHTDQRVHLNLRIEKGQYWSLILEFAKLGAKLFLGMLEGYGKVVWLCCFGLSLTMESLISFVVVTWWISSFELIKKAFFLSQSWLCLRRGHSIWQAALNSSNWRKYQNVTKFQKPTRKKIRTWTI